MIRLHYFVKSTVILLLLLASTLYFAAQSYEGWHHGYDENTLNDMSIFVAAGKHFLQTGELYQRSGNYPRDYAPDTPVYKFPPAYQLTLLPLLHAGLDDTSFLHSQHALYLLLYLVAFAVLLWHICRAPVSASQQRILAVQAWLVAAWFAPFAEAYLNLHTEVLILFLVVLALAHSEKYPFATGIFIAMAAAIKIYPAFLCLYFVLLRQWKALAGFLAATLAVLLASTVIFGMQENQLYYLNILPVLLRETAVNHSQNLMIEKFLLDHRWIGQMNGHVHFALKLLCLLALLWLARQFPPDTAHKKSLYFAMIISLALVWLTNYWLQYQMLLLVPLIVLIGEANRRRQPVFSSNTCALAVLLCVHERWSDALDSMLVQEFHQLGLANYLPQHGLVVTLAHSTSLSVTLAPAYCLSVILHGLCDARALAPYLAFLLCGYALVQPSSTSAASSATVRD